MKCLENFNLKCSTFIITCIWANNFQPLSLDENFNSSLTEWERYSQMITEKPCHFHIFNWKMYSLETSSSVKLLPHLYLLRTHRIYSLLVKHSGSKKRNILTVESGERWKLSKEKKNMCTHCLHFLWISTVVAVYQVLHYIHELYVCLLSS